MHPNVHWNTVYSSQDMKASKASFDREMDKEDVVHRYNGLSLSHQKKEIMPSAATRMDLETVTQSEVSQTEKDKYHMTSLKCEIKKKDTNELIYKAETDSQT